MGRAIRSVALPLVIGFSTISAAAQYWVLPATTPGVDVKCTGCFGSSNGLLTPGYPSAIKTFSGRFLDSQATNDFQQPFRTARAFRVWPAPSLGRIYMTIGSAVMAYDAATFFARLSSGEALMPATAVPVSGRWTSGRYDRFLAYDSFFYAENEPNGWQIALTDGQERLFGVDYDDQGYVYLAYSVYGWGIVQDDPARAFMFSQFQDVSTYADNVFPLVIASLKGSDGRYWALISGAGTAPTTLNVWDVTSRSNPTHYPAIRKSMFAFAKTTNADRIGIVTNEGTLQIYTTDSIVSGGTPLAQFSGVGGAAIKAVGCDGTNFFATSDTPTGLVISVFTPLGNTYTRAGDYTTNAATGSSTGLRWGDGYLVWTGFTGGTSNLRVFKLQGLAPAEIDFSNYFQRYYTVGAGAGYTHPSYSVFWDSAVVKRNGKVYLIVTAYGLGDVYELPHTNSIVDSTLTITPSTGSVSGGTNVTITGTGFAPGATVTFGGMIAANVNLVSGAAIVAATPPHAAGPVDVVVRNSDGESATRALGFTYTTTSTISGDVNGDGTVAVSDVFYLINSLFSGGPPPAGIGDANGDGQVNVADAFYLINYLFAGGPAPR